MNLFKKLTIKWTMIVIVVLSTINISEFSQELQTSIKELNEYLLIRNDVSNFKISLKNEVKWYKQ